MAGVYHITTSDFDPRVNIDENAYPKHFHVGEPEFRRDFEEKPPDYATIMASAKRPVIESPKRPVIASPKRGRYKKAKTGHGQSHDVIVDIEHQALNRNVSMDINIDEINLNRRYDAPEIVVTFVETPDQRNSASVSSSECDEGIGLDHGLNTELDCSVEQNTSAEQNSCSERNSCADQNNWTDQNISIPAEKNITVNDISEETIQHNDKVPLVVS